MDLSRGFSDILHKCIIRITKVSTATSPPINSGVFVCIMFNTYRSASCVQDRIRVSPARRVTVRKNRYNFTHFYPQRERTCTTHRCEREASCSCKEPQNLSVPTDLFPSLVTVTSISLRYCILFSSSFGDQSPRNLRSYRCALSSVKSYCSCCFPLGLKEARNGAVGEGWL